MMLNSTYWKNTVKLTPPPPRAPASFSKTLPPNYGPGKGDKVSETPGRGSMLENVAVLQMRAANLTLLVHNQICTLTLQIRPLATPLEMISLFTFACSLSLLLFQHYQPGQSFGAAKGTGLGVSHSAARPRTLERPALL